MDRKIPSGNKLLQKLWEKKSQKIHKSHLKNIKSQINLKTPPTFTHLKFNAKNFVAKEERFFKIERENQILLTKIAQDSRGHSKSLPKLAKSLNKVARKKNIVKITLENLAIEKRISEKKSAYDIGKWEKQREKEEKLLGSICEFPYTLGSVQKMSRSSRKNSAKNSPRTKSAISKISVQKDCVIFTKTIKLGKRPYLIQVKKDEHSYIISALSSDSKSFNFNLSQEEGLAIMGGTENINKLVQALKLDGDDLILVEYSEY